MSDGVSSVMRLIETHYRKRKAGRSARAVRDFIIPFKKLVREAACQHGPERDEAIRDLNSWEKAGILILERSPRDLGTIFKVRLPLAQEAAFFQRLGTSNPESERRRLEELFRSAVSFAVPERFREGWLAFCEQYAVAAYSGASINPFERNDPNQVALILGSLPRILAWPGESLMRFASVTLFGDSKRLELLRSRMETCLSQITGGAVPTLADAGISDNERSFLLHGPLRLIFAGGSVELDLLETPVRIGSRDIRRAQLALSTSRCLTVENAAMLHELAKLRTDTLLVSSGSEGGFANSAVIDFLRALPSKTQLWHFGDSDPKGFDILRDLRERVGKEITSLQMNYRPSEQNVPLSSEDRGTIARLTNSSHLTYHEKLQLTRMMESSSKGKFEQESLGLPRAAWPFYFNDLKDRQLKY